MIELLPVLISNIVVASALSLVATVVGWSGRRAAAARWIWLAVFVKLVTPPLVAMPIEFSESWSGPLSSVTSYLNSPRVTLPRAIVPTSLFPTESGVLSVTAGNAATEALELQTAGSMMSFSLVELLVAIWFIGSLWLLVRGARRYVRMVRLLQREAEVDAVGTQAVRELLQRRADQFVPSVRLIRARLSPMLFGIGRNTSIVCPRELWLTLDDSQRLGFLAHEASHYVRRDHWVRWVEWLVASLYWWLPLVVWARWQLERHEEVACDQAAIELLQRHSSSPVRRSYAESLLSVVDFLSEAEARAPRLASRMQPTAALEERLHWIMKAESGRPNWRGSLLIGGLVGALSLLIHPTIRPWSTITQVEAIRSVASGTGKSSPAALLPDQARTALPSAPELAGAQSHLPPAPRGWWNSTVEPVWADREFGQNKIRLVASAVDGIDVSRPGGLLTQFDARDVRGLAYLPGNDRLVIGRSNGELHLWDVASARSVSLIGKHSAAITSTSWSAVGGLVSSDRNGTIVRWDLQSGQMLASVDLEQSISAVRWSSDGREVAVLTGSWSGAVDQGRLMILNGTSLAQRRLMLIPNDTAVVQHDASLGWLAVAWSGSVLQLSSGDLLGAIPKHEVTGVVMCAELMPALR